MFWPLTPLDHLLGLLVEGFCLRVLPSELSDDCQAAERLTGFGICRPKDLLVDRDSAPIAL